MLEKRPKTVILDIDGTLVWQGGPPGASLKEGDAIAGTVEKLWEWDSLGYRIVLMTGRREGSRAVTEKLLSDLGIIYDTLVMDAGSGVRVLVNDIDPKHADIPKAIAVNIRRNEGIANLKI